MKRFLISFLAFVPFVCALAQPQHPGVPEGPGPGRRGGLPKVSATICDTTRSDGTLRLLYWNIQNGMWADQDRNYDTFVEWVRSYDPDICVWCEAATIYEAWSTEAMPAEERRLPDGWPELAARYGHSYVALGGWRDNYPQVITSKHPIETLLKITDTDDPQKPVAHGAALQVVRADSLEICFVTLHTWPHAQGYGVSAEDLEASKKAFEGDFYRQYEISRICDMTVNCAEYASKPNWIMLGDFNSISSVDNWHYGLPSESTKFLVHNYIRDNTSLVDVIARRFPGQFVASSLSGRRIDYVYASEAMFGRVDKAMVLTDDWTFGTKLEGLSNFCYPSDHFPILVDFRL